MEKAVRTFSMVRLNRRPTGFAVIDDRTGAIVRPDGALALRLTAVQADQMVQSLNGAAICAAVQPAPSGRAQIRAGRTAFSASAVLN